MDSILGLPRPDFMADEELMIFEDSVARFIADHLPLERMAHYRAQGMVDRALWADAGKAGLMGLSIPDEHRSEEHTSELQSLMRISYAVFCLKKKKKITRNNIHKNYKTNKYNNI